MLIEPDTVFIRKGSVLANRAGHCNFKEREASLLIEPDTAFIGKGSLHAIRARHCIYFEGK